MPPPPHPDLCVQAPAHIDEGKVGCGSRDSKASQLLRSEGSRGGVAQATEWAVIKYRNYVCILLLLTMWWRRRWTGGGGWGVELHRDVMITLLIQTSIFWFRLLFFFGFVVFFFLKIRSSVDHTRKSYRGKCRTVPCVAVTRTKCDRRHRRRLWVGMRTLPVSPTGAPFPSVRDFFFFLACCSGIHVDSAW